MFTYPGRGIPGSAVWPEIRLVGWALHGNRLGNYALVHRFAANALIMDA